MGQVPRTRGVESTRAHKLAYRMPCSCRAEPGQDQEVQGPSGCQDQEARAARCRGCREAEDLQRDRGDHRDPGGSEQAGASLFYHITPITSRIFPIACRGSGQNIASPLQATVESQLQN